MLNIKSINKGSNCGSFNLSNLNRINNIKYTSSFNYTKKYQPYKTSLNLLIKLFIYVIFGLILYGSRYILVGGIYDLFDKLPYVYADNNVYLHRLHLVYTFVFLLLGLIFFRIKYLHKYGHLISDNLHGNIVLVSNDYLSKLNLPKRY